jgi:RimJ/RimL family protein N-acetyltransferase
MNLFWRKGETFTVHNSRSTDLLLWLEPWCEEFRVPAGRRLDLVLEGRFARPLDAPFELNETHLAFFAPGGSRVRVLIDGELQPSGSSQAAVPSTGKIGTRALTGVLFSDYPEGRLAGAPDAGNEVLSKLGAPMAEGDVHLEPLTEAHRAALKAACAEDREVWAIYSTSYGPGQFDANFEAMLAKPDWRSFALFRGEKLVGMSSFMGVDLGRMVLEIGSTYYLPAERGTGFNRIVKNLMLGRAFQCGFRRIEFRVDARNGRSQAAMAKLGAVREGVLREDRITWNGHVRDTVLFSILASEWNAQVALIAEPE